MKPPVIGVTLDAEGAGGWAKTPWYALRKNYFECITKQGAIPFALPHVPELAEAYLDRIDGLLIPGGAFDIPPEMYGAATQHSTVSLKTGRTAFEYAMTKGAYTRNMPMLGICGGEQLLNVILGGTLIQHVPEEIENALEHEQKNPRNEPSHNVTIKEGTLLHRIVGMNELAVNSSHHQAVKAVGKNVIVNCTAPDGVIEGIESTEHPFCLGVEWHPEYEISGGDTAILRAFVEAASQYGSKK